MFSKPEDLVVERLAYLSKHALYNCNNFWIDKKGIEIIQGVKNKFAIIKRKKPSQLNWWNQLLTSSPIIVNLNTTLICSWTSANIQIPYMENYYSNDLELIKKNQYLSRYKEIVLFYDINKFICLTDDVNISFDLPKTIEKNVNLNSINKHLSLIFRYNELYNKVYLMSATCMKTFSEASESQLDSLSVHIGKEIGRLDHFSPDSITDFNKAIANGDYVIRNKVTGKRFLV